MQCVSYTVLPFPVAAAANGDVYTLAELIAPSVGISTSFLHGADDDGGDGDDDVSWPLTIFQYNLSNLSVLLSPF